MAETAWDHPEWNGDPGDIHRLFELKFETSNYRFVSLTNFLKYAEHWQMNRELPAFLGSVQLGSNDLSNIRKSSPSHPAVPASMTSCLALVSCKVFTILNWAWFSLLISIYWENYIQDLSLNGIKAFHRPFRDDFQWGRSVVGQWRRSVASHDFRRNVSFLMVTPNLMCGTIITIMATSHIQVAFSLNIPGIASGHYWCCRVQWGPFLDKLEKLALTYDVYRTYSDNPHHLRMSFFRPKASFIIGTELTVMLKPAKNSSIEGPGWKTMTESSWRCPFHGPLWSSF